jgi:hypothetical protein
MADFVGHHEDLSSDRGYQFRFHCDRCTSFVDTTPTKTLRRELWRAAGKLVGGATGSISETAFEANRIAGDPEHDAAFAKAVAEARRHFRACGRCGRWVCVKACYHEAAKACEDCEPNPDEESLRTAARRITDRERQKQEAEDRLYERDAVERTLKARETLGQTCPRCGATGRTGKFCNTCGAALSPPARVACSACGAANDAGARFCEGCGKPLHPPAL